MKSTFSRNFVPATIILLVALLLVGTSFWVLVRDYLTGQAIDSLHNDAQTISSLATAYYSGESLSDLDFLINLNIASQVSGADAVICDSAGRLALCSDSPFGCETHRGLVISTEGFMDKVFQEGTFQGTGLIQSLYPEDRYYVAVPILNSEGTAPIGVVLTSMPTESTHNALDKIAQIYVFVSLFVIVAAVVFMTIFARRESKPLTLMARTANAFGHGDLDARVMLDGNYSEDIEELALAFNNMASSLQKSEYQRQEFVANVSHELKTPMTTIGGYIDGMLDGTIPAERHEQCMRVVSDETKRLSRLVRSMLDISRLQDQGGMPEEKKTRFDLEECAGQVLITFEQKITAKGCNVEVDMPDHPVFTHANQDAITQVIYNLLDNAVKFCPSDGTLGLKIREGNSKVYISVFNEGETIPPEELPLVFDRFHKIDKSRTMNRDGWGLGLYIVKTIVCSHGEDISVSSLNGRTDFTFTLPLII